MILDQTIHSGVVIGTDFLETGEGHLLQPLGQLAGGARRRAAPGPEPRAARGALRGARTWTSSCYTYLSAGSEWRTISVTDEGGEETQNEDVAVVMAFVLIMIIYIMVIMYGSHTLTAVIEEKSSRMVEVLLASVSPDDLMLGKVLGIGAAGLTQFGIWAADLLRDCRQRGHLASASSPSTSAS